MNRRHFLAITAAAWGLCGFDILVACSGSGASSLPASPPRSVAPLYGYFALTSTFVLEVAGHTNCVFAPDNFPGLQLEQIATLQAARAAGIPSAVISVPYTVDRTQAASEMAFWLGNLDKLGLLASVRMVYVGDEVNDGRFTEAQVRELVATARSVMATFPALNGAAVGVSYVVDSPYVALDAADWIGLTAYHYMCGAETYYDAILAQMRAGQKLVIYPGGSLGLGQPPQEPGCFMDYAQRESRVAMVAPFAWQTITDRGSTFVGIREEPAIRAAYEAAGKIVVGT